MSRITVVGDALLDCDVSGRADRLCPDAPVPVLTQTSSTERAGGAALAATMLALDGADVTLITALGDDSAGERVRELVSAAGVALLELPYRGATAEKIRLRADQHPLLRLDRGDALGRLGPPTDRVLESLRSADAVLVSDYGRGLTGVVPLRRALSDLTARTAMVWDPHPRGSTPVRGARLICPNRAETATFAATHGTDIAWEPASAAEALAAEAGLLRQVWRSTAVAVPMGAAGALLVERDRPAVMVPASLSCQGLDTCGAGDRFAAALAIQFAAGQTIGVAVAAAVESATQYVAARGPAGLPALTLEGQL